MPNTTQGSVTSLWRYPVKSMLGEEVTATQIASHGLLGDRAYALVDSADGKAATAKNPKGQFSCSVHASPDVLISPCPKRLFVWLSLSLTCKLRRVARPGSNRTPLHACQNMCQERKTPA